MVKNFEFIHTPKILFGKGTASLIKSECIEFGSNLLIIIGEGSLLKTLKGKEIISQLSDNGLNTSIESVSNEPSPLLIDKIFAANKEKKIDVVIAIGGGSVLDTGKAVSVMLMEEGLIKEYLEGVGTKKPSGKKVPFIAVPTTAGTGSETTNNAVISKVGSKGFKKSLRHNKFVPDVAIVDPEFTLSCSGRITAFSGMDAFTQLLESYLSLKASPVTDALAFEGLIHLSSSLIPAYKEGDKNLDARTGMAFAAMISGITLTNAGLGLVHGFASSIGGYFNIPHGIVCGTLMAECNASTVKKLFEKQEENKEFLLKYVKVGKLFTNKTNKSDTYYIDKFIEKMIELTNFFNLPCLSEIGISNNDLERIINNSGNKNNPVQLDKHDMKNILLKRF